MIPCHEEIDILQFALLLKVKTEVIRYACKAADFESYFREFQGCYGVEGIAMSDYSSFM